MRLAKSRFKPPYDKNGRTTLRHTNGKKGVYLIKVNGKLRYIGYSGSNLYKTIYRHFQSWDDPRQARVTYKDILDRERVTVRVVLTNRSDQAAKLEKALILLHQPADNPDKLERYTDTPEKLANIASALDDYECIDCTNDDEWDTVPF